MQRFVIIALGVTASVVGPVEAGQEEWPQFRGTQAGVVADDPNLPDTWSETANVVWINLWMAFFGILPIPLLDFKKMGASEGLSLLYGSRWGFVGVFLVIAMSVSALVVLPLLQSILAVVVLSAIGWILYYVFYEQNL